jgi:hypothetical protein
MHRPEQKREIERIHRMVEQRTKRNQRFFF